MVMTFFCLMAVVGLASMLARQLSRALGVFLRDGVGEGQAEAAAAATMPELAGRQTAQIEAPREPAASVTENTTRTFDPVYQERRG
jgi:hypothetical protein